MGQSHGIFTETELQDYKDLTYFTKKEVLYLYKKFKTLSPDEIMVNKQTRIAKRKIMDISELKTNPFKDRICDIFSSSENGDMMFEDFLDMMSVFSSKAPRNVKTEYAFRIFDFDGDDLIGRNDVYEILKRLTGSKLIEADMQDITDHIMQEADLDEDGFLAYAEFEHMISKSPDFMTSFCIKL